MSISSIMAIVDGELGSAVTMQTALRIGETFDAHTALVQVLPPLADCTPLYCQVKEQQIVDFLKSRSITLQNRQRERFETLYEDTVINEGILSISNSDRPKSLQFCATKVMITGHENQEVATRGRLFDMIVLPPASELPGGAKNATLEAALLDTGRPVLLAARETYFKMGHNVTIAWDGSRHAAISVRNALPFIRRSNRVDIVHAACGEVPSNSIESLAAYLSLHGIKANTDEFSASNAHPSDVIVESAMNNDAAIVVMGAHGLSHDNDCACGSVTERIIEHSPVPVFLSH